MSKKILLLLLLSLMAVTTLTLASDAICEIDDCDCTGPCIEDPDEVDPYK